MTNTFTVWISDLYYSIDIINLVYILRLIILAKYYMNSKDEVDIVLFWILK